jgi:hypothetical protein
MIFYKVRNKKILKSVKIQYGGCIQDPAILNSAIILNFYSWQLILVIYGNGLMVCLIDQLSSEYFSTFIYVLLSVLFQKKTSPTPNLFG